MYPIKPMTDQLNFLFIDLVFMILVMFAVLRFKRVELQVVQDQQETTMNIFKKLKWSSTYQLVFIGQLTVFQVTLFAFNLINDNKQVTDRAHSQDSNVIEKTMAFDIVCIYLFVGLVANFVILLFSIVRLIKFLTNRFIVRMIWIALMLPLTCVYVNQCFQMAVFNWGFPANDLTSKLKEQGSEYLYFYEYF